MKIRYIAFFFLVTVLTASAQPAESGNVKSVLQKLFEYAKSNNFRAAAVYVAYTGEDAARNMKSPVNFAEKNEADAVKRICWKIGSLLEVGDSYDFGKESKTDLEGGAKSYDIEVNFKSGGQKLTTVFKFVKADGKTLLYSVE